MRSQRDLVVAVTSILFASVGCGNDKSDNDTRSSGGQTSASSSAGGTHRTETRTAPSDNSRGSGGTSSSLQTTSQSSSDTKNGGGGAPGATSASGFGGQLGSVSDSATGSPTGGGSKSTRANGSDATGGTAATTGPCTTFGTPTQVGSMGITTSDKTQISGIVASRDNPGILYAQADSGQPVIHALDTTGKLLGTISLSVTPKDWEDLSIGINPSGTDYLYVGDIGDNAARTGSGTPRSSIVVYRFPEPAKASFSTATPTAIASVEKAEFTYPSGAHDAETLIVDPTTQDLLILTKDENGKSIVYRAPDTAFKSSASTKLEEVAIISTGPSGQLGSQVSAGDISPSGDTIILRTYGSILLFPRLATLTQTFGATPVTLPSPTEQQGEGLTFASDGRAWICAGETSTTLYSAQANCK